MRCDLITRSLERAATLCPDMAPLVYARLFAQRPDLAALFRENASLVQGEMLAKTFEAILDFVDGDSYAGNLVAVEAATHAAYDVPRDAFVLFFRVVADTLRDVLGPEWTLETARAWNALVVDLSACAGTEEAVQ